MIIARPAIALFLAAAAAIGWTRHDIPASARARGALLLQTDTGEVRLMLAAEGNEARYRVREQLANIDFPSDAIGRTSKIEGAIVLDAAGQPIASESKLTIDLASLASDSQRRDNYIRRRTLVTDTFPTAVLVPTEARGLPAALPSSGELKFQLIGNLTVHGVTRPSTWEVTAQFSPHAIMGQATTRFTFADFGMTKPRVASVLSVGDDIKLEYDFNFMRH